MSDEVLEMPKGFSFFDGPRSITQFGIIDFHRTNGYFQDDIGIALEKVVSLLDSKKAAYCKAEAQDFDEAPEADGWIEWEHQGTTHGKIGRKLFNWLRWKYPTADVRFNDEPDFQVVIPDERIINGDIGRVSVSTFVFALQHLGAGDWWLSVSEDGKRHVIIIMLSEPILNYPTCVTQ